MPLPRVRVVPRLRAKVKVWREDDDAPERHGLNAKRELLVVNVRVVRASRTLTEKKALPRKRGEDGEPNAGNAVMK